MQSDNTKVENKSRKMQTENSLRNRKRKMQTENASRKYTSKKRKWPKKNKSISFNFNSLIGVEFWVPESITRTRNNS